MATKQDFERAARIFRAELEAQRRIGSAETANVIALLAKAFANDYAGQNGRFDRGRFYHACGLDSAGHVPQS